jgi:4-hydroxybenzoate polyprenyltransferase
LLNPEMAVRRQETGVSRLKLFLALSRTPHGLLDLAAPALAALLCLGHFPPLWVTLLGLLTVFAGYTAVYALNDVVDYRVDREKLRLEGGAASGPYLDAVLVRHPLAAGRVSLREGLAWTGAWALVAFLGAYALNPVCALIFVVGCLLEAAYCLLLKVSHLRLLVAGVVKGLGALAAVFAVDPQPSPLFLAVLFLWLFGWELGGQNIPADWHDVEQDRTLQAKTIPVVQGLNQAAALALVSLTASVTLSLALGWLAPVNFSALHQLLLAAAGLGLLLLPAGRLYRRRSRSAAAALFNRASYYPLAVLGVVLLSFFAR